MCFFFSSRRRHTIWPRDWSSDVCSSDLRTTGVVHAQTAGQTFRGTHGNSAHHAVTQLLLNFEGEIFLGYSQRVIDVRHLVAGELNIDNRTNDLYDTSATH